MLFASAISDAPTIDPAIDDVLHEIQAQLGETKPNIGFWFVSNGYQTEWGPYLQKIRETLDLPILLGCTAGATLGRDKEIENKPGMSLTVAHMPDVHINTFQCTQEEIEEEDNTAFWIQKAGVHPDQEPVCLLFPEPFSCDAMTLVDNFNQSYPRMPIVGGLASGARQAGENALFLNEEVLTQGSIGVLLSGNVEMQTIVSQGCRPIGRPFIVTKAQDNILMELAGTSATEALQKLFTELPQEDQLLARQALLIGVVMDEYQASFQRGDFLIRNLIGIDHNSGALVIGDHIAVGQTVQFHVRDAKTSKEDLKTLLDEEKTALEVPAAGALLFSCLGRGQDLYGEPHFDTKTIQDAIGNKPLGGFFCNGEIGPVGEVNFIHGFTASLGLFRPRR